MSKTLGYIYANDEDLIGLSDPSMIAACTKMKLKLSLGEVVKEGNGIFSRLYVVEGDPSRWVGYLKNVAASCKNNDVQFKFTMEVHEHEH